MIKHGVPEGSILGPLLFIIYINDLPSAISTVSEHIILADATNVIISSKNFDDFHTSNIVLPRMSNWFSANKLAQHLDKTNIIKLINKNLPQHTVSIGYKKM
jgi:hypothetical protein